MVLGPILGAGVGLAQTFLNVGQQNQANAINWRAVMETIRSNRKQEQLQTADRGDAYGNKLVYTPGVGWEYKLTGSTKGILDAEQRERLANLTQDAPRNRAAAERMDRRSQAANDQWEDTFREYQFRTEPSEEEYIADTRQTLMNSRKRGLDEAANLMAKQLLRTGGGSSNIAKVYSEAGREFADSLEDVNLKAKSLGRSQFRQDRDSDMAALMSELNQLRGAADQTTTSPVEFSNFNESLTGRADSALQQLAATLSQGSDRTRQALQQYAQGKANTQIDLSGIAKALSGLGAGSGKKDEYYPPRPGQSDGLW